MRELAEVRGVDPDKYTIGIGQDKMAVPMMQEDIIAMAANACDKILDEDDKKVIDQIIFATESGVDYSKAAAVYIHELLGIQPYAKAYEMKQACYSATAAIMNACDYVRLRPSRKILVIASDISRYGLKTGGEPTQGAGAIAILISANPSILAIDMDSVSLTRNDFDFWRPDHHPYPLVEGKYSTELYLSMFNQVMAEAERQMPEVLSELQAMVFHTPFTRMGYKALTAYQANESTLLNSSLKDKLVDNWLHIYNDSVVLNRKVGNVYTASLYLSLISLFLYSEELKADERIGLFSYGSGAVAELITGTIQPKYLNAINKEHVQTHLERRTKLSISEYEELFDRVLPDVDNYSLVEEKSSGFGFYLESVQQYRRHYQFRTNDNDNQPIR